jgi:hypothetical protein
MNITKQSIFCYNKFICLFYKNQQPATKRHQKSSISAFCYINQLTTTIAKWHTTDRFPSIQITRCSHSALIPSMCSGVRNTTIWQSNRSAVHTLCIYRNLHRGKPENFSNQKWKTSRLANALPPSKITQYIAALMVPASIFQTHKSKYTKNSSQLIKDQCEQLCEAYRRGTTHHSKKNFIQWKNKNENNNKNKKILCEVK